MEKLGGDLGTDRWHTHRGAPQADSGPKKVLCHRLPDRPLDFAS